MNMVSYKDVAAAAADAVWTQHPQLGNCVLTKIATAFTNVNIRCDSKIAQSRLRR